MCVITPCVFFFCLLSLRTWRSSTLISTGWRPCPTCGSTSWSECLPAHVSLGLINTTYSHMNFKWGHDTSVCVRHHTRRQRCKCKWNLCRVRWLLVFQKMIGCKRFTLRFYLLFFIQSFLKAQLSRGPQEKKATTKKKEIHMKSNHKTEASHIIQIACVIYSDMAPYFYLHESACSVEAPIPSAWSCCTYSLQPGLALYTLVLCLYREKTTQ